MYELPFTESTDQWLIQTHTQNGRVRVEYDGAENEITLPEKTEMPTNNRLEINILRLKQSNEGALILDRAINPASVRQGRRNQNTGQEQRRNGIQNVMPGSVQMPKSGNNNRAETPSTKI